MQIIQLTNMTYKQTMGYVFRAKTGEVLIVDGGHQGNHRELERVLTSELGSKEDYEREFGDTPFGLLIRKIAKLDHDAAMAAFSQFINDQSLNQKQIAFLHKIINHIEQNGYMESVTMLTKPPFDKPLSFTRLFDKKMQIAIMAAINRVKDNAVVIAA